MEVFSGKCRKHPISNKQPGICSICLRDRLLQLADAYNNNTTFNNTLEDRCLSFSTTSTSSSPPTIFSKASQTLNIKKHVRHASSSDVLRSISYVIGGREELKKSRSIATTMMEGGRGTKRDGSFWKKLLRVRGGKNQMQMALGNSMTLKDRFVD